VAKGKEDAARDDERFIEEHAEGLSRSTRHAKQLV
jgi:hypothetical protein